MFCCVANHARVVSAACAEDLQMISLIIKNRTSIRQKGKKQLKAAFDARQGKQINKSWRLVAHVIIMVQMKMSMPVGNNDVMTDLTLLIRGG